MKQYSSKLNLGKQTIAKLEEAGMKAVRGGEAQNLATWNPLGCISDILSRLLSCNVNCEQQAN